MNFGQALEDLKRGKRAERAPWMARNLYVGLVESIKGSKLLTPVLVMKEAHRPAGTRWLPQMVDLLASDWQTFDLNEEEKSPS